MIDGDSVIYDAAGKTGALSTPTCSECGVVTDDEWHTCLPCMRCEHDKPYHNLYDDWEADVECTWPGCDCSGYLGAAA